MNLRVGVVGLFNLPVGGIRLPAVFTSFKLHNEIVLIY